MKTIILSFILFSSVICSGQTPSKQTTEELEFFQEVNLVRTNPKLYASIIRKDSAKYSRYSSTIYGELLPILENMTPLPALLYDTIIRNEMNQHKGIDTVSKVVHHDHDFLYTHTTGENITQGMNIRKMVIMLLVDVEYKNRGHRLNILNKDYKYTAVRKIEMGIFIPGKYTNYKQFFVQDFKFGKLAH